MSIELTDCEIEINVYKELIDISSFLKQIDNDVTTLIDTHLKKETKSISKCVACRENHVLIQIHETEFPFNDIFTKLREKYSLNDLCENIDAIIAIPYLHNSKNNDIDFIQNLYLLKHNIFLSLLLNNKLVRNILNDGWVCFYKGVK